MNIFEYAAKNKLRFPFKGLITTEDLFDLSLSSLDTIYKTLNRQVKQTDEESLLATKTKEETELSIQIEIVKYVFNLKVQETSNKQAERERKEQKQKIMAIMESKKEAALQDKSLEELEKMLKELE